jgi:hypothetical protein
VAEISLKMGYFLPRKESLKKISLIHYTTEIKICKDTNGAIYQGM